MIFLGFGLCMAGPVAVNPVLVFENGSSLQTEDLWVSVIIVLPQEIWRRLLVKQGKESSACRGRHPHLDTYEEQGCDQEPRAILLGASNGWFPVTLSVLAIPLTGNPSKNCCGSLAISCWGN